MARSVPLSRFTSRAGGGSAFFVRPLTIMNKFVILLSTIAATTLFSGCVLPMSPLTHEARAVSPLTSQTKEVVFKEPMVWYDQSFAPTRGIMFPQGTYQLEAEDSDYLYFHAPAQIEYRSLQGGSVTDDQFMPGGVFLAKAGISLVPAGAYSSVDEHTNVLTWKLGGSFLRMEGSKWTKNF